MSNAARVHVIDDDAEVRGGFLGLDHDTSPERLAQAVLEGVAFAFRDARDALATAAAALMEMAPALTAATSSGAACFWIFSI